MLGPGISLKRRHGGAVFALGCGCKDAKSVSVSASSSPSAESRRRGGRTNPSASSTTTTDALTLTSASSSSFVWEDAAAEFGCNDVDELAATQSFSGLLRELSELEQSVASWGPRRSHRDKKPSAPPREHSRKVTTKSGGGDLTTGAKGGYRAGDSLEVAGLDGSVAVVKQSEDPLGDFRQSMAQMIVENGIVSGEELREMLRRFLGLNAPHHHDVILRAFAEIWDAVFSASFDPVVPVPAAVRAHKYTRREPPPAASARPPMPRTPPRHHHPPSAAWRV